MKKYLALVIATLAMGAATVWADSEVQSEVVDGVTWYYRINYSYWDLSLGRYVYVTNATVVAGACKYTGDLVIPSLLGGYPVERVESAFHECTALKSIVVPEGVTCVSYAFWRCTALTNVTLASTVTGIGPSSFADCTSLKDVVIPNSVTACDNYAFGGCTSLTNVILSANLKNIPSSMFSGCSSLNNVVIPESVTGIGEQAFCGCSALTQIVIPTNVTSIGSYAFWGCTSLTEFNVPASVTSIGNHFLRGCSSLIKLTVSKDNPNCKSVNNCIVSASGTTLIAIPYGCAVVVIPDGVSDILEQMFYEDYALTKVTIPSSVTSIGDSAFYRCSALASVTIPEGVTSIGNYAFYDCSALTSVTIPSSVTSIGDDAFYSCESLVAVELPASLENIGRHVFSCCTALNLVLMQEGFRGIGYGMFSECRALRQISIPSSVTSIGTEAFYNCDGLTSVTIPSSVTSIAYSAFFGCYGLKEVIFLGAPLTGVSSSGLLWYGNVSFPRSFGAAWLKVLNGVNKFRGYDGHHPDVSVLSSKIREKDPTILDVVYKVTSSVTNTVKVRALAFEDGVRSFANVVRPTTFVADTNGVETAGNVGDAVAANVEHTLSWKMSADWSNQLAKVSFEVLATEGDLLPLEVRTIPASDQYGKMDVTWNAITESQWFDALLWLYADQNPKVTLSDGVYYYDGKVAAKDAAIYYNKTASSYYSQTYDSATKKYVYVRYKNAPEVVLEEMGYTLLSGEVLNYVNEETRLGLSPSGARQYGYRIVDE